MFKLADLSDLVIEAPVDAAAAAAGGGAVAVRFTLHCRVLPDEAIARLAERGDRALLDGVVCGWAGVAGDDGAPLPFSPEHFARVSAFACLRVAMVGAYYEAVARAARKN